MQEGVKNLIGLISRRRELEVGPISSPYILTLPTDDIICAAK